MIRKAIPADLNREESIPLVIEALRTERYPTLVISLERIRATALECITSAQNFAWVCEKDGKIVGAVGATTNPGFWFERSEVNVVMFYCKAPGEGIALLRELVRWFRSRPILKRLNFVCEYDADPRLGKLLERLGLNKAFPTYSLIK